MLHWRPVPHTHFFQRLLHSQRGAQGPVHIQAPGHTRRALLIPTLGIVSPLGRKTRLLLLSRARGRCIALLGPLLQRVKELLELPKGGIQLLQTHLKVQMPLTRAPVGALQWSLVQQRQHRWRMRLSLHLRRPRQELLLQRGWSRAWRWALPKDGVPQRFAPLSVQC